MKQQSINIFDEEPNTESNSSDPVEIEKKVLEKQKALIAKNGAYNPHGYKFDKHMNPLGKGE